MERLPKEWIEKETVVVADADPVRFLALANHLEAVGFSRTQIQHAADATRAIDFVEKKQVSIFVIDESLGTASFRELHATLVRKFGSIGFFIFAVTEGQGSDFVQFAASARIDGVIFRPFRGDEFQRRIGEVFSVKWPNRIVAPNDEKVDLLLVKGAHDKALFDRALEKAQRLGDRDALTPDPKVTSIFGAEKFAHPAIRPGKAAFDKVRLSFKAVARNGVPLEKTYPIHAMEVDDRCATFECPSEQWEPGDHVSIEAEIVQGGDAFLLRIEAIVVGEAGVGLMTVQFDPGNRSRIEAAMKMVAKRFRDLKDFFKYAKGA